MRPRRCSQTSAPCHRLLSQGPTFLPSTTGRRSETSHPSRDPGFLWGPLLHPTPPPGSRKGREEAKGQTHTKRILELGKEMGWGGVPGTLRGPGSAGIDSSTAPSCLDTLCLAVALSRPTSPGALLPVGTKRPPQAPLQQKSKN